MKTIITILILMLSSISIAQDWLANGTNLNNGIVGNRLGTFTPHPIDIYTANNWVARFTRGNQLNTLIGNSGDGLRIMNPLFPFGSQGNLDLFTSSNMGGNETHIRFGGNGQISGQANRMELRSYAQGFYFISEATLA